MFTNSRFHVNTAVKRKLLAEYNTVPLDLAVANLERLIEEQAISPRSVAEISSLLMSNLNRSSLALQQLTRLYTEAMMYMGFSSDSYDSTMAPKELTRPEDIEKELSNIGLPYDPDNYLKLFMGLTEKAIPQSVDISPFIAVISFQMVNKLYVYTVSGDQRSLLVIP